MIKSAVEIIFNLKRSLLVDPIKRSVIKVDGGREDWACIIGGVAARQATLSCRCPLLDFYTRVLGLVFVLEGCELSILSLLIIVISSYKNIV